MEITGTQRIEAPREAVYAALNDPAVLVECIPGCEMMERVSDTVMKAMVRLKIGPMKVSFAGALTLSDLDPPNSYTLSGEGSGGIAGFAKGHAAVRLEAEGEATLLHYTVTAETGGRIAQLGARLVGGTARKLANEFFAKLGAIADQRAAGAAPAEPVPAKKTGWFGRAIG